MAQISPLVQELTEIACLTPNFLLIYSRGLYRCAPVNFSRCQHPRKSNRLPVSITAARHYLLDLIVFLTLNMDPITPGPVKFCLDVKVSIRGDDRLLKVDAVWAVDDLVNSGLHGATEVCLSCQMMS